MNLFNSSGSLKKYHQLLILLFVFLIFTLFVLVNNMLNMRHVVQDAHTIDVVAKQGTLLEQMSTNILDVNMDIQKNLMQQEAAAASEPVSSHLPLSANNQQIIEELAKYSQQFDHTLQVLAQGGEITVNNQTTVVMAQQSPEIANQLKKINDLWKPYHALIQGLVLEAQTRAVNPKNSAYLVEYTRRYHQTILQEINQLVDLKHASITAYANNWRNIQWLVIAIIILLGGVIVFWAMGRLVRNDETISQANLQMQQIMSAIREGLFLIEKDFTIGDQHSSRLENILGQKNVRGQNFLHVIASMLPENEVENTKLFIEQLYNPRVVEDLIEDLNPLHRISVYSSEKNDYRYLDFKFFRVMQDDEVQRILVSVIDSTESVVLQSSLQAQEEQEQREVEMLSTILHTDSRLLNNFIHTSQTRLDDINEVLQSPDNSQQEMKAKVNYIGRVIHSLKGDASALRLERMVDICSTIEDSLTMIRKQPTLSGQDFFSMIILIEDLYRLVDILDDYSRRMSNNSAESSGATETSLAKAEIQKMQEFAADIAYRNDKKVNLLVQGLHDYDGEISDAQRQSLNAIITQLLRNAVVHGVEYPAVRLQRGKPESGSLKILLNPSSEEGHLMLIAEDDGNGIDFEAIRNKAVAQGRYTVEQVGLLNKKDLLALMMSDGFSTAAQSTEDAGKGIGMGIVKQMVHQMGGKLNISTTPQQYTRFSITFPIK